MIGFISFPRKVCPIPKHVVAIVYVVLKGDHVRLPWGFGINAHTIHRFASRVCESFIIIIGNIIIKIILRCVSEGKCVEAQWGLGFFFYGFFLRCCWYCYVQTLSVIMENIDIWGDSNLCISSLCAYTTYESLLRREWSVFFSDSRFYSVPTMCSSAIAFIHPPPIPSSILIRLFFIFLL